MKLVLAEKPSVAQSIAKVLGAAKREDGYLCSPREVVSRDMRKIDYGSGRNLLQGAA